MHAISSNIPFFPPQVQQFLTSSFSKISELALNKISLLGTCLTLLAAKTLYDFYDVYKLKFNAHYSLGKELDSSKLAAALKNNINMALSEYKPILESDCTPTTKPGFNFSEISSFIDSLDNWNCGSVQSLRLDLTKIYAGLNEDIPVEFLNKMNESSLTSLLDLLCQFPNRYENLILKLFDRLQSIEKFSSFTILLRKLSYPAPNKVLERIEQYALKHHSKDTVLMCLSNWFNDNNDQNNALIYSREVNLSNITPSLQINYCLIMNQIESAFAVAEDCLDKSDIINSINCYYTMHKALGKTERVESIKSEIKKKLNTFQLDSFNRHDLISICSFCKKFGLHEEQKKLEEFIYSMADADLNKNTKELKISLLLFSCFSEEKQKLTIDFVINKYKALLQKSSLSCDERSQKLEIMLKIPELYDLAGLTSKKDEFIDTLIQGLDDSNSNNTAEEVFTFLLSRARFFEKDNRLLLLDKAEKLLPRLSTACYQSNFTQLVEIYSSVAPDKCFALLKDYQNRLGNKRLFWSIISTIALGAFYAFPQARLTIAASFSLIYHLKG